MVDEKAKQQPQRQPFHKKRRRAKSYPLSAARVAAIVAFLRKRAKYERNAPQK